MNEPRVYRMGQPAPNLGTIHTAKRGQCVGLVPARGDVPEHRCTFLACVTIDGERLCKTHANAGIPKGDL